MVKLSIPPFSTNADISIDDRSFNLEHISDSIHTASEVPGISHKPAPLICSIYPYVYKIAFWLCDSGSSFHKCDLQHSVFYKASFYLSRTGSPVMLVKEKHDS